MGQTYVWLIPYQVKLDISYIVQVELAS